MALYKCFLWYCSVCYGNPGVGGTIGLSFLGVDGFTRGMDVMKQGLNGKIC
jgi:hypothetical protein